MSQPSARPSLIAHSTARPFRTGRAPGNARHTGHVWVFGSAPHSFAHRQNIFVRVLSCTWISRPMTGSHSDNDGPPLELLADDLCGLSQAAVEASLEEY